MCSSFFNSKWWCGRFRSNFMAKGAKVMLISNLRQLYNGTRGTLDRLLYREGHKDLPIAILVTFPGLHFLPNKPHCIPLPPKVYEWHDSLNISFRQQIPLRLSYEQWQMLYIIDIGGKEMAAGCTFVALSRLKALSGLLIQPMIFECLQQF